MAGMLQLFAGIYYLTAESTTMKRALFFLFVLFCTNCLHAQLDHDYDSVTISRFLERRPADAEKWNRAILSGYSAWLVGERTIWVKGQIVDSALNIFSLADRIWQNGSKSIGRCFVPRHTINFYRAGKISRYLLVCFECNGMEFSDLPKDNAGLLVSKDVRMKQIEELRFLFKDML